MRAEATAVAFRLRSAVGHLEGVIRMVDDDRYCIDVLHQLSAVQGALESVRRQILEAHLRGCVPEAVAEGRVDDVVDELLAATFGSAPTSSRAGHRCHDDATHAGVAAGV
jgi:DNA-binding FrmR family transcriptional regulator